MMEQQGWTPVADQSGWTPVVAQPPAENRFHIGPSPEDRPVTLGDLQDDPKAALMRIGSILKKDATDPKLWLSLAASYFAPKVLSAVMPKVAQAASTAMKSGANMVGPAIEGLDPDLVAIASPRAGAALKKAQQLKAVLTKPAAAGGTEPVAAPVEPVQATSPVESASGGTPLPADRPVSPAPVSVPTAAHPTRTAGQMSPTAIQSDLGLAARRAGVSLPPNSPQAAQAEALVRQGQTIEQAVQAAGIPAATATPTAPPKPKLTADEFRAAAGEYVKLRQQGMTDAQAKQAIVDALAMQKSLGLKTPTTAQTKFPKGMRGKTPSPEP